MKPAISSFFLRSIGVSLLALLAALPVAGAAVAQTSSSADDLLNSSPQSGEASSDLFSGNGSGQMGSMFDLIHRATTGSSVSSEEFLQNQRENLNTEAQDFRTRQLERLQQSAEPARPEAEN